jgi:quinol monooxygenase YgiN
MGWLKMRPGKREEFVKVYQAGAEATRKEPGCVFYDYGLSATDPDMMTIMECFESEESHAVHLKRPHFRATWEKFEQTGVSGDFWDVWSDEAKPSSVRF